MAEVNKIFRLILITAAFAVCAIMMTGCWDDAEINGRAFVLGFGADSAGTGGLYDFTFQLAIPVSGESTQNGSIEYAVFKVTERTPASAVRSLQKDLGRQINFEQLNLIVIGEELSQKNYLPLTDYFFRRASVRRQSSIAVCEGSAEQFFSLSSADRAVSTEAAVTLQSYGAGGGCISMDLFSLFRKVSNAEGFFLLRLTPVSARTGGDQDGSGEKFVSAISGALTYDGEGNYLDAVTFDELETMRLIFCGAAGGGAFEARDGEGKSCFCDLRQSDCSVKCSVGDGRIHFGVELSMVILPLDVGGKQGESYPEEATDGIAGYAAQTARERVEALARRSRETLGSSVLGLQDIARQRQPEWYEANWKNWEKIYSASEITVNVECSAAGGGVTK